MAIRGQALPVTVTVWNTVLNRQQTGDTANLTLRWLKDDVLTVPVNAPAEKSATYAPGEYTVQLTAAECDCWLGKLVGVSSTPHVIVIPQSVSFESGDANVISIAGKAATASAVVSFPASIANQVTLGTVAQTATVAAENAMSASNAAAAVNARLPAEPAAKSDVQVTVNPTLTPQQAAQLSTASVAASDAATKADQARQAAEDAGTAIAALGDPLQADDARLARLDVAVSTRATPADVQVSVTPNVTVERPDVSIEGQEVTIS